jgi:uncharacterized membrane protein YeaQ/YmgE (transglycosylase-associated protein family)
MNLVLWIAAGGLAGWAAFALLGLNHSRGPWISALIGAAGGIIGGKLVAPVFVNLPPGGDFSMDALAIAVVLAAAALAAGNLVQDRWGI